MKKFKVGLIIIVALLIAVIATLFILNRYKKDEPKAEPVCETGEATTCKVDLQDASTVEATKTTVGSFGDKDKISNNIYQNDKFKFQITFSDFWNDAQVKETIPGTNSEGQIEFQVPTTDKAYQGYAPALTITLYKKDAYNPSSPFEMKLTENTNYIVTYRTWDQPPTDATITEKEVANTATRFKFIN